MHVDAEEADAALKRLQRHLGYDSRCAETTRVLRPVGSTWRKDGEVRPVELVSVDLCAVYPIANVLYCTEPPADPDPVVREAARRPTADADDLGALEAALKAIPPPDYVPALTGRKPNRAGKIACPLHKLEPVLPRLPDPEQG